MSPRTPGVEEAYGRHGAAAMEMAPESTRGALSLFWGLWLGLMLAVAYEVAARQATHYALLVGRAKLSPSLLTLAGITIGLVLAFRTRRRVQASSTSWSILLLALAVGLLGSAPLMIHTPGTLIALLASCTAGASVLIGSISCQLFVLHRKLLVEHGVLERWLNPFRLFAFALAVGLTQLLLTRVGLVRSALGLAAFVAALGAWFPRLHWTLRGVSDTRLRACAWIGRAAAILGTLLTAASEWWMPSKVIASFENDVIAHIESTQRHYSITTGQQRLQVFEQGVLRFSSLDAYRYYESLAHPALTAAKHRDDILVLGSGSGLLEREILRYDDVRVVHVIMVDSGLHRLSHKLPVMKHAAAALSDPRIKTTTAEPLPWLRAHATRYDVIFVDLLDPHDYFEGKHFTRYFYGQIAKHLKDGGVASLQVTSPFSTPAAYDSILASVKAAGLQVHPYAAPVPTLRGWGFALAGSSLPLLPRHPIAAGLAFLNDTELVDLLRTPPDVEPRPAPPSLLYEQHAVERTRRAL